MHKAEIQAKAFSSVTACYNLQVQNMYLAQSEKAKLIYWQGKAQHLKLLSTLILSYFSTLILHWNLASHSSPKEKICWYLKVEQKHFKTYWQLLLQDYSMNTGVVHSFVWQRQGKSSSCPGRLSQYNAAFTIKSYSTCSAAFRLSYKWHSTVEANLPQNTTNTYVKNIVSHFLILTDTLELALTLATKSFSFSAACLWSLWKFVSAVVNSPTRRSFCIFLWRCRRKSFTKSNELRFFKALLLPVC